MPPASTAVQSLLSLLKDVRNDFLNEEAAFLRGGQAQCHSAALPCAAPTDDELADFTLAHQIKQRLLARRAERLARFLRLSAAAGSGGGFSGASLSPATSHGSTPRDEAELSGGRTSGSRPPAAAASGVHPAHDVSAEEMEGSSRTARKLGFGASQQSPGVLMSWAEVCCLPGLSTATLGSCTAISDAGSCACAQHSNLFCPCFTQEWVAPMPRGRQPLQLCPTVPATFCCAPSHALQFPSL